MAKVTEMKKKCAYSKCGKPFNRPGRTQTCSDEHGYLFRAEQYQARKASRPVVEISGAPVAEALDSQLSDYLKKKRTNAFTVEDLANKFDRSPSSITAAIARLKAAGHNFAVTSAGVQATGAEAPREPFGLRHDQKNYKGGWLKIGACGDKHYGSKHCRHDVIEALYDLYEAEGVTSVFDTGNWIDGEARFNFSELVVHGMEPQVRHFVKHHPKRKGITTYFVAGDDHEGWYQQRNNMSIGAYAENIARESGREDLVYLGYMEADIRLKTKSGESWLKVMHPGGGSAYAESYTAQKIAESFQGGEKPHICLVGHYHKMIYGYHRGIHMVQTGTGEDQTSFMRKKRLSAALGGTILDIHQAPTGEINRFRPEFFTFFDRTFYNRREFDAPEHPSRAFDFQILTGGKRAA